MPRAILELTRNKILRKPGQRHTSTRQPSDRKWKCQNVESKLERSAYRTPAQRGRGCRRRSTWARAGRSGTAARTCSSWWSAGPLKNGDSYWMGGVVRGLLVDARREVILDVPVETTAEETRWPSAARCRRAAEPCNISPVRCGHSKWQGRKRGVVR